MSRFRGGHRQTDGQERHVVEHAADGCARRRCFPARLLARQNLFEQSPAPTHFSHRATPEEITDNEFNLDPARVYRSFRRFGRGASAPNPASLCPLLQRHQNTPVAGQSLSIVGSARRRAASSRHWQRCSGPRAGWLQILVSP